jgi:hypothetical protein
MANARIDRMLRELHSEPSIQFFQGFFELKRPASGPAQGERTIPASLLEQAPSGA